ncbi:unnamed protein product [Mycena citricolor]|uniref:Uncharacterized protein n=1 Tax=Mycena citricolor TaxID=2018698 RepID=A0AAD2GU22_9AGAR|nr:unnamed protein product [Mycena citricolor]
MSDTEFGITTAQHRMNNPHLKVVSERPTPTLNAKGEAPFQRVQGGVFPVHHIARYRIWEGIDKAQRKQVESWDPAKTIIIVLALGGQHLFNTRHNEIGIDVKLSLSGISDRIHYVAPVFEGNGKGGKYAPPIVAFLRCEDPATRDAILAEPFIAVNNCTAYWPTTLLEEKRSWTLAHFEMSSTTEIKEMEAELRGAIRERMHTNNEIVLHLDRMTQPLTGSLEERIDSIALSIDAVYKDDGECSTMAVYMDPSFGSETEQLKLRELLRQDEYIAGAIRYKPTVDMFDGSIKNCVICKLDDHPSRMCPFTAAKWWGPPDQLSRLPTDHPLASKAAKRNDRNNHRGSGSSHRGGGPRTRGGGNSQDRGRGRGRRT